MLDTWFSSGLWPFCTLGWPDETPDLRLLLPHQRDGDRLRHPLLLGGAHDHVQGIENTGQVPFHTVYLHGLVRDEQGRKMSKSVGNVVDPLDLVDKYGTDALRMALITNSSPGNDQKFSDERIEQAAHFANKLWNATRFVLSSTDETKTTDDRRRKIAVLGP